MKRGTGTGIVLFFLFSCFPLFAQNGPGSAFFVSDLRGELRNNLIRLSWNDSPQLRGPVYIYRSVTPFEESFDPAELGQPVQIPYGVQSYIDEIEQAGTYYYFAATSDERGQRYMFLSASGNSMAITADPSPGLPARAAQNSGRLSSQSAASGVRSIRAETNGGAVVISFVRGSSAGKAILYRSSSPIRTSADLLNAVMVQLNVTSPFTDYPVPGFVYHYALVNEDDLIRGTVEIIEGVNTAAASAGAPGEIESEPSFSSLRVIPLPQVTLAGAGLEGSGINRSGSAPAELGPEAAKTLESISGARLRPAAAVERIPRILSEDTTGSGEGEFFLLGAIANGSFSKRDWAACLEELNRFLSLPRSDAAAARARFYLGQSYFFMGRYRDALFEFLGAQTEYPDYGAEWIQACLPFLNNE